ncbi:hypothetical protein NPIL_469291 [Nephila pilipes]|uniref:Magnesium transporter NIPA2 n=1 Tax=Nephila pilipes TaxID=299642 RepID=A0A8X6Q349_NEPPI|nr:hypothetical protein NPIL_469291 [Nephila pilipes]
MIETESADLPHVTYNFYIGLGLAVSSSLFIGSSFVIKKKGLLRIGSQGQMRAGLGGYSYLKEWIWWAGLLSMGIGEAANFTAYAFAPASLVTPLGVLSVLVSAIFSSRCLGERLNLLGKIGCFLCIIGSTIIVLHAPKEGTVDSMERLGQLLLEPGFVIYTTTIIIVSCFLVVFCVPRYGSTNVVVYILLCSMIGSLSVMECKGLGLALRETVAEWGNMAAADVVGSLCGFFTVVSGIFLLNVFREWDISLNNLSSLLQKKEDAKSSQSADIDGTSIVKDCHSQRFDETSVLLERHSRQNSLESRTFATLTCASENVYNSLLP